MITRLLIRWAIMALSLWIVTQIIPGFEVRSVSGAVMAAIVLGLVNGTIGTVIKFFTFPLTLMTLGLFWVVVNAAMLMLTTALVKDFKIATFTAAFLGAICLSIVNMILRTILPDGSKKKEKDAKK
jgi:putative membrane protein